MRICIVSGDLGDGGAQRVVALLANQFVELGHSVSVYIFNRLPNEYAIDKRVELVAMCESYSQYKQTGILLRIARLRSFLRMWKPDVAVGFVTGGTALFCSSLGMSFPKIATARVDPRRILNGRGFRGRITRLWFRYADAVVLQTEQQLDSMDARWKQCFVIPNPISGDVASSKPHYYERPFRTIISVGRLAKQKNHESLIRAAKEAVKAYPHVDVNIFGIGELFEDLEGLINQLGLQDNVHLRGWTDSITDELDNSDLFVMTSKFEGMPNALIEAMGKGLPCISTDCRTGPSDLIVNGMNGLLVPVDDQDALEKAIIMACEMSWEARKNMGMAARTTILQRCDAELIANQWMMLFNELVSS